MPKKDYVRCTQYKLSRSVRRGLGFRSATRPTSASAGV